MKINSSYKAKRRVISLVHHSILYAVLVAMCLPFYWMICTSFKTQHETLSFPPTWFPHVFTFQNYVILFQQINFIRPLWNSFFIGVVSSLLSIIVCSMAAYAFAKFDFKGSKRIFMILLGSMMVPGVVTLIPVFILIRELGLMNSYTGLIVPGIAGVGMIFFFRQFLLGISNDYIHSARIDGAGEVMIFWKIVFPMMRPAVIAQGLFAFTGAWNSFLWPLIITTSDKFYTLPLALTTIQGHFAAAPNYGVSMAGSIVVIIPLVILFIFTQKHFLNSMNIGGVKE